MPISTTPAEQRRIEKRGEDVESGETGDALLRPPAAQPLTSDSLTPTGNTVFFGVLPQCRLRSTLSCA